MAEQVSSLLRRSVEHLEVEVPESYHLVLKTLGPMVVEIDVDGDLFSLRGGERLQVLDGAVNEPGAQITTSRATILDVLDAKVSLGEAVEAGTVGVRGSLDDVQRAHDTLFVYVHAAVRAASQPELLSALRTASQ